MLRLDAYRRRSKDELFWRPDLISIGITLFLFSATVKPGYNPEFQTVTYSFLVLALKTYSPFIGIIGLFLLLCAWASKPRLVLFKLIYPATWLLAFKLLLALRLVITPEGGLEHPISFLCTLALYFIILSRDGTTSAETHYKSLFKGLYYFTTIIILLNAYLLLFEYSTSSWKGRFLGVFQHPNFAGVNFAICVSMIFGFNITHRNAEKNKTVTIFSTLLVILAMILVMASGSRTGILGLMGAALGYAYIQKYLKSSTILFLAFPAFIVILSLDSIIEVLAQYIPGIQRISQAGNTRNDVWLSMWNSFTSNPFFGAGYNAEGTAGSYLRVLAQGGLFAGLPLIICILLCITRLLRTRGNLAFRNAWLPGLLCILLTSVTEGYLADALSLGIIYFVLIVFALSFRRPVPI